MPSVSRSQHDFFQAVANSPAFAKKVGVSKEVADEYLEADRKAGKYQKKEDAKEHQESKPKSTPS